MKEEISSLKNQLSILQQQNFEIKNEKESLLLERSLLNEELNKYKVIFIISDKLS